MKVIGLESGRVTMLVDILELSPLKGATNLQIIESIRDRYGFSLETLAAQNPESNTVRLAGGRLDDGRLISFFEIHSQGLVVQGVDTKVCDDFLAHVLQMGQNELGLRPPTDAVQKIYASNIVVQFEHETHSWLAKFAPAIAILSDQLRELYGIRSGVDLYRLAVRPDPNLIAGRLANLLPDFAIERRVFATHQSERFYSVAPLPTDKHLALLEALEKLN